MYEIDHARKSLEGAQSWFRKVSVVRCTFSNRFENLIDTELCSLTSYFYIERIAYLASKRMVIIES